MLYLSEYLITKSRMDCEFHECVKLDKEDWNKAQALQMGKLRGYTRLVLANRKTAIILSTGMYLKLTKNGEAQ